VSLSGLVKFPAALILITVFTSATLAAPKDLDFLASPATPKDSPRSFQSSTGRINSSCFAGYSIKFIEPNSALDRAGMSESPASECFQDIASIALHKDGGKIIWSLTPSLGKYSLNPIDDLRNIQVLLRYRF
jgi:hypothetical protein